MDIEGAQSKVDGFVTKWNEWLYRNADSKQKQAVWYLWTSFFLALRSLRNLAAVADLPGCWSLARCCLDYDVSISAIFEKPSLGDKYIDHMEHARNRYIQASKDRVDPLVFDEITKYVVARYGPDFTKKRNRNWHGNADLFEIAKRTADRAQNIVYCEHLHGSVFGMQHLNLTGLMGGIEVRKQAVHLLGIHTLGFMQATRTVTNLLLPSIWTPDKQACGDDLEAWGWSILDHAPQMTTHD